jgi:hypothetical protein
MKWRLALTVCVMGSVAWGEEDWTSSLKNIPMGGSTNVNVSFGGKVRLRWEHWENFSFAPKNDDDFLLARLFLYGDLKLGQSARLFVEGISAQSSDRDLPGGERTIDVDSLDLHQAFVDLTAGAFTLRPGRQELLYGKQRLISPLDWANTRRTFDGGKIMYKEGAWQVDAFGTRPVIVKKYDENSSYSDQEFYGVYATHKISGQLNYDVYALGLDKEGVRFGAVTNGADESRYTIGTRVWGMCPKSALDYDVEAAWQFGDYADQDIAAWMLAIEAGYTWDTSWKPRAWLGFDYASGDDDPSDGDLGTFNQLFPLGHAFLGYIDTVGRQNIVDYSGGLSVKPRSNLTLKLDGHVFQRVEKEDALYNAGGAVVRAGDTGSSRDVGQEVDLLARYELDRHTSVLLGYSRFFAGNFIKQSGPSEDTDFVYGSIEYIF